MIFLKINKLIECTLNYLQAVLGSLDQ